MAKSPEEMQASMIANLKDKTGKTLDQWTVVVKKFGTAKHGEVVKHLKTDYGVGHGYANLIVHVAKGDLPGAAPGGDDLVTSQYAGGKAALKPIYDELAAQIGGFGRDVELSPKKSYVSLRRNKQFGLIQPSTKSRVDVGINLKGKAPTDRLEPSGSFNSMVSHRVRLSQANEVDDELIGWLREAYEEA